jgi:putative phosphoribosyl transferase
MHFRDRADAATQLAGALARFGGKHPLVLAIPRGAVPMGAIVARALGGDLDVVLTRKIGAPGNPEFAIGAVGESGWYTVDESAAWAGAGEAYIAAAVAAERAKIAARRAAYAPHRPPIDPHDRLVIVLDDGLATGATMEAALHDLRERGPRHLVCAAPVASVEARERVTPYADEIVCLACPAGFGSVGQYYDFFPQVSDDEVLAILRDAGRGDERL